MSKIKKKWLIIAGVVVLVCGLIFGICYFIKTKYTVKTVFVEGSFHYTQEEIESFVMNGLFGNNSLYLSMKYKNKDIENIPFVDVMNVTILAPDTVKITVFEKALAGYVKQMDTYTYFDKDGFVVENSSVKTTGVPQITGLRFNYAVRGKQLPVEDSSIFEQVLNITKLLNKYKLIADKIQFLDTGEIIIYFANVSVNMGNENERLEDKIMCLPEILDKLAGQNGTLHMESYDEKGNYTFRPEKM